MKEKVIAIYCGHSPEDVESIQRHFFGEGVEWYSAKFTNENKYKKKIDNYIIVESGNLYEGDDNLLNSISDIAKVLRFNTPIEFLRLHKIKKLKTKLK